MVGNKIVSRNNTQYEQLSSEYLIKATPKLDEYSLAAHNLYNRALFDLRQGKSPVNRRIKRGLFKANDGRLINADINGALQIIRKVFSNFQVNDEIAGVVLRPVKWSPKF